jgi:hypothetical protein
MILFSWDKVRKYSKGSNNNILKVMFSITWPYILPTRSQRKHNKYYDIDFYGHSYLKNPEDLLVRRDLPPKILVEYIMLAARRNYADFIITGDSTLDSRLAEPTNNELLTTIDGKIHFAYE